MVLLATIIISEPNTALLAERVLRAAEQSEGSVFMSGLALDELGRSVISFTLPKHRAAVESEDSAQNNLLRLAKCRCLTVG